MRVTMLSYAAAVCAIISGWFFPFEFLMSVIVWQFMLIFGLGIGVHRYFSHAAFKCNAFWQWTLATTAMTALHGPPGIPAHVHALHHAYADTEKDPLVHLVRNGPFKTRSEGEELSKKDINKIMRRGNLHRLTLKYHWAYVISGIAVLTIIGMLLGLNPVTSVFWMWLAPAGLAQFTGFFLGWAGHRMGCYRNFETNDLSRNSILCHLFLGSEGLHNNHHNDPRNPNNAVKWWEFDPSYLIIKMIRSK